MQSLGENAEIPELREKLLKFAEVEAENAKLKQIIEENARRDSENAELESRVGELEAKYKKRTVQVDFTQHSEHLYFITILPIICRSFI